MEGLPNSLESLISVALQNRTQTKVRSKDLSILLRDYSPLELFPTLFHQMDELKGEDLLNPLIFIHNCIEPDIRVQRIGRTKELVKYRGWTHTRVKEARLYIKTLDSQTYFLSRLLHEPNRDVRHIVSKILNVAYDMK
jgi:hypothetical protein